MVTAAGESGDFSRSVVGVKLGGLRRVWQAAMQTGGGNSPGKGVMDAKPVQEAVGRWAAERKGRGGGQKLKGYLEPGGGEEPKKEIEQGGAW